jgi:inner membrane transporter RhtA
MTRRVSGGGRGPVAVATVLVVGSTLSASIAAALSVTLVAAMPASSVSALRLVLSALVMLALFRPRFGRRPASEWVAIGGFGLGMAGISICLHEAITRIPIGIAITLEFLGPCAVALLASRRIAEAACAVVALIGVVLIAGPGGGFDLIGFAFALGAAFFLGMYTVFAERVGKSVHGMGDLTLSVMVGAGLSLPFIKGGFQGLTWTNTGILLASALLGVLLPYLADTIAARLTSARVIGTLFSLDPVMGTLVGVVMLGQAINTAGVGGIAVVVAAGAGLVWTSGRFPRR